MWQVDVQIMGNNTHRSDYFPRQFAYKQDAEALKKLIERNQGVATVSKVEKKRVKK